MRRQRKNESVTPKYVFESFLTKPEERALYSLKCKFCSLEIKTHYDFVNLPLQEELLELRSAPASLRRPECLSEEFFKLVLSFLPTLFVVKAILSCYKFSFL